MVSEIISVCSETGRVCKKCGIFKEWSQFSYKRPSGRKAGYQPRCKVCAAQDTKEWNIKNKETARERYLQRSYGISENKYNSRLLAQNNTCPICSKGFSFGAFGPDSPVVDHCHTNGHVRGIICNECNRGLGYFKDNEEALMNAAQYLIEDVQSLEDRSCSCLS